jgi:hypothetical protein
VSLKAWTGDIDPYDSLEEAWIQMSGIPSKWSNWKTYIYLLLWASCLKWIGILSLLVFLEWSGSKLFAKMCPKF